MSQESTPPAPRPRPVRKPGFDWSEAAVTACAIALAFVIGAVLMVLADPAIQTKFTYFFSRPSDALSASAEKIADSYGALFRGAFGGIGPLTNTTAQAAPLICAGLGIGLAFRAGLFNIGGQGQAIMGAMFAALVGFKLHGLPLVVHLPLAILAGVVAGGVWGGFVGFLKARLGAHEVIVTIMMNYIASGLLAYALTQTLFKRPGRADPISPIVEWNATFPRVAGTQLHLGFLLALVAAFVVWVIIERTTLGFRIRAVGSNPSASATAGMSVANTTMVTMALSGALAGLAGVQVALGPMSGATPTPLTAGLVGSIGFDAITVALLGRSRPLGTVFAGLLFGALHAGGLVMQGTGTPKELTTVLQALVVMFVATPMLVRTLLPFLKQRRARRAVPAAASQGGLA
ncbi:ABC transporter permease [Aestuariimicrobium soli]|uniref:ABC transporter permease n=1 Tax=Aestuariimicrobium soli TaxID=2035834 RepID=UPI003EBED87B